MRIISAIIIFATLYAGYASAESKPSPTPGYKAWKKHDLKTAVPLLEKECKANNYSSCTYLGLTYADQFSGKYAPEKAFPLFKKACEGKYYQACTELAFRYEIGSAVEASNSKAFEYYDLACENGEGEACFLAAETMTFIWEEEDEIWDNEILVEYYTKACKLNWGEGCFQLGDHYENGWGVEKSQSLAIIQYKKAAGLGDPNATKRLKELGTQ